MLHLMWAICVMFLIVWIKLTLRRKRRNSYLENLPKIPFKVLLPLLRPNITTTELFQIYEKATNYFDGDGLKASWIFTNPAIVCDDPVNLRTILKSKDCSSKTHNFRLLPAVADGISLKTFEPTFNRRFSDLAKSLEKFVDHSEFELTEHILGCNLKTFLDENFRYGFEALNGSSEEFIDNATRLWKIRAIRGVIPTLHPVFIHRLNSLYAEEWRSSEYLKKIARKMVLSALEERKTELSNGMSTDFDDTKPKILIDRLLDLEEKGLMDRQCVLDQIITIIIAGIDTSPFTVLNTLLLLAVNQTVQNHVYKELRANITDADYIDFETLSRLEYLDRVLKESMRLLPTICLTVRETSADLALTDCTVPKGTILLLNFMKMLQSEKIWGSNALEFDPDRFLPEAAAQRHPFAFIPFSVGPRDCIGNKYAMFSMKAMLCHLLLKYKFSTSVQMSDISYKFDLSLKLNNKYMFKLEKRN